MLLLSIVLGVVLGLLLKGNLDNFLNLKIKKFYLILLSLLIQLAILASPLGNLSWLITYGAIIYILSILILLAGLLFNWKFGISFRLIILGTAINLLVITANLGTIPVDLNKLSIVEKQTPSQLQQNFDSHQYLSYRHPLSNQSNLSWLGDVIYIPVPLLDGNVYSVGDVVISFGMIWFVSEVTMGKLKKRSVVSDPDSFASAINTN